MNNRFLRYGVGYTFAVVACLLFSSVVFGQGHDRPAFGPVLRPKVKITGFLNAKVEESEPRPVLTLALPGDEKRYTFLLYDMKILAGPLRTPDSILSEVKPFSTNFYVRTSPEAATQISSATPTERLTIIGDYSSADRVLFVEGVEKGEDPKKY